MPPNKNALPNKREGIQYNRLINFKLVGGLDEALAQDVVLKLYGLI